MLLPAVKTHEKNAPSDGAYCGSNDTDLADSESRHTLVIDEAWF